MTNVPLYELSESAQNYLKAIWSLQEWSSDPVTASSIATKTGMKLSTASGAMTRLANQGLVIHSPYGAIELTEAGRSHAVNMVRRHRLVETFLVQHLGYTWDQVHDEAEALEHVVSEFMLERISAVLGHPSRDPHGDPIPAASGEVSRPRAEQLSQAPHGTALIVERISDHDPQLLRHFAAHQIFVGTELISWPAPEFVDGLQVQVGANSAQKLPLGVRASDAVWVSYPGL